MDVRAWCQRSLVGADTREACDDASFGVPASIHPRGARRRRRVEARIEQQVRSEVLSRGLGSFSSRQLSQLLWANALADTTANDLLVALRQELLVVRAGRLDDFADVALVHVAWALARLLGQPSQLGADIVLGIGEELARRSLHSLHSRHVSTLLWAMARLGADSLEVFDAAEAWLASTDLCGLSEQSLVMVIWAMTTVSRASSESLVRVCMSVCVRAPMCVFQVRAHTHARMHARTHAPTHTYTHTHTHTHTHTQVRVEAEMLRRGLASFQPQELNAAVFAFSMTQRQATGVRWTGPIWDAIDAEAVRRMSPPTATASHAGSDEPGTAAQASVGPGAGAGAGASAGAGAGVRLEGSALGWGDDGWGSEAEDDLGGWGSGAEG